MSKKKALVTGVTGQDGSYLAEFLLAKGYDVFGMVRHSANPNYWRIKDILTDITLIDGDLTDQVSLNRIMRQLKPDEVYNLAAQSFVKLSFDQPLFTADVTGLGVLRILEAIRQAGRQSIKFYQASSSEMFGKVRETPQTEMTQLNARSPYGAAKIFAHCCVANYRDSYDMFNCCGILFNHESERRGLEFVTRKITDAVAKIKLGKQNELRLGNLDAKRDWGHARDYVEAMWLMLQQPEPDDYVISTGETHTVREFCEIAFKHVGLDYNNYVVVDPKFFRPTEVEMLLGDSSKAKTELGWSPKISFKKLVELMVDADLKRNT